MSVSCYVRTQMEAKQTHPIAINHKNVDLFYHMFCTFPQLAVISLPWTADNWNQSSTVTEKKLTHSANSLLPFFILMYILIKGFGSLKCADVIFFLPCGHICVKSNLFCRRQCNLIIPVNSFQGKKHNKALSRHSLRVNWTGKWTGMTLNSGKIQHVRKLMALIRHYFQNYIGILVRGAS